jgi:(p)ppGpp synthase/HD superfamily hydrolase
MAKKSRYPRLAFCSAEKEIVQTEAGRKPMQLSERFNEAFIFAANLHAQQKRKGTKIPYIAHLLGVTSIALEYGATEDEAIGALLHDAVEDQGGAKTQLEIKKRFGNNVERIVVECSDTNVVPKPPWKERKVAYIHHILDSGTSPSSRLVSAADKLHNSRAILKDYREVGEQVWNRFNAGKDETLWYYRELVKAFRKVLKSPIVDELDRVVTEIELLAHGESDR